MPKDTLSQAGGLWENYSHKVSERMNNPTFRGEITEEQAKAMGCKLLVVDWGAASCGDAVRLFWAVDPATDTVKAAKFFSFGCGTAIASSDLMCEMCIGKKVNDVLAINNIVVEAGLRDTPDKPAVPPQKMHCSVMAHDVLKKAVSEYRGVSVESLEDSQMVCHCARVTLGTIKDAIRLNDLTTVEQITQYTKAGGFCKSCIRPGGHEEKKYYLCDILKETREEMERDRRAKRAPTAVTGFKEMNPIKKAHVIQSILDKEVAPMLNRDGGSCDVVDVKDDKATGETLVYIEYAGACVGCSSAHTSTLGTIEEVLRKNIDPSIKVLPTN